MLASAERNFVSSLQHSLLVISIAALLITSLLALTLSYHLVQPIKALRRGTRELTKGNYTALVRIASNDELGALSHDFNHLAKTLNKHEDDRRQWVVDIAHELRTPIAILRAEMESVQDGIEPLTPDTIHAYHQEILHLQHLIDDLYDLSMSDIGALSYKKSEKNIIEYLQLCLSRFRHSYNDAGIHVIVDIPETLEEQTLMLLDQSRIVQLFDNLLKNTLRYTDAPGELRVSARMLIENDAKDKQLEIVLSDSAPGVADDALGKLFDRLYRQESSRNRELGGAGIGLAICKNIVVAHEGSIVAQHSEQGGVTFTITFPILLG